MKKEGKGDGGMRKQGFERQARIKTTMKINMQMHMRWDGGGRREEEEQEDRT